MSGSEDEFLTAASFLSLLEELDYFEYGNEPDEDQSQQSSSTILAEVDNAESSCLQASSESDDNAESCLQANFSDDEAESCLQVTAGNDTEDFGSIASQETLENGYNQSTIEAEKHDPERDKLLALLEDDGEPEISVEDMLEKLYDEKKEEEINSEKIPNSVLNKAISINAEVPGLNTPLLHPNVNTLIDLTDDQKVVTIKVEPAENVVVIDDDPCVKEENQCIGDEIVTDGNKIKSKTLNLDPHSPFSSLREQRKAGTKDKPIVIEDDPPVKIGKPKIKKEHNTTGGVIVKSEKQSEPVPSTSRGVASPDLTEKETDAGFNKNEPEDGEVLDDDSEITVNNVDIKPDPMSLIKPALGNVAAAAFGVHLQQALFASLLTDKNNIAKMAKNINKLTKYVSKTKGKKRSRKRKSNYKRSRKRSSSSSSSSSRSRSRSRSATHKQTAVAHSPFKKIYRPKQYQSRSPSRSPLREREFSPKKRNYRSNNRSKSSSRSFSKSPERKQDLSKRYRPRSISRSPSPPKTKALNVKKYIGKRSPSESPPRRKRKYSSSSSSSTDKSSSSPSYRRRRRRVSSRSKSRSRSRTPKTSHTVQLSKKISSRSVSSASIGKLPSSSQQTIVAQQTYQQEVRQGHSVMTRKATVTTSYEEELQSFKNSLVKTVPDSSNGYNDENLELNKLEITVFDECGRDVTSKRPDGDLNHPFFIHPEDAELYQMKCRNGLSPLQALHEICVKCKWNLPKYLILPTPKGFRFGMEIEGHRFMTERVAQQKKLAKAAAATVVLQWLKIIAVSLN